MIWIAIYFWWIRKGKRVFQLLDSFRPTSHILNVFFNAVCLLLLKSCIRPVCSFAVPHSWPSVLLCSERKGPLSSTSSTVGCLPPHVPRAGYVPSTLLLLDTQPRSYSIRVWLYETLIVIETVIDRYLVFKTWAAVGRVHFDPAAATGTALGTVFPWPAARGFCTPCRHSSYCHRSARPQPPSTNQIRPLDLWPRGLGGAL